MSQKSFTAGAVGRVFFVRWLAPPGWSDAQAMLGELATARSRAGEPLIFCAVLSNAAGPFAKELRSRMKEVVGEIRRHCDHVHVALEGEGVVVSLMRTVIRGALVASRLSAVVSIHDSVSSVCELHAERLGQSPAALIAAARKAGVL